MYPKVPINPQMTPVANADSTHLRFSLYYFGARLLQSVGTMVFLINKRMALDTELSALRDVLSNALVDIDNLRSTIKHSHQQRTRSSSDLDRPVKRGSQLRENTIKELASYLRRIGELVNAPDPAGDSHPATGSGDLGGSPETAAAERNAAAVGSDLPAEHANGPLLTLGRHQMGRELVRSLKELCGRNGGVRGKITCTGIPRVDLRSLRLRIPMPKKEDGIVLAVKYAGSGDIVTLLDANLTQFQYPMSSALIQRPHAKDIEQFVHGIQALPPTGSFAYYVGDALNNEFDGILETDDELRQLREAGTEMRGVNTTYWLLGAAGSGTAAHCEDLNLRSCNITLEGYKWWVVVNESSTRAFEEWAKGLGRQRSKPEEDDQWVRRMNLIPKKTILVENKIGFSEHVTGPGEMITTAPRQYHWVINITDSLSLAINFSFDDELRLGLESLPITKRSPMWGLKQKLDQMRSAGSAPEATSQPVPPGPGQADTNAGEPDNQDDDDAAEPDNQNDGRHGRILRPRKEAPGAYYSPAPAKRQRRGEGGRDSNALPSEGGNNTSTNEQDEIPPTSESRQNQQQQEMELNLTGGWPFPQPIVGVERYCDVDDRPRTDDENVFQVLLTLRRECAVDNYFAILRAWRDGDCHPRQLISDFLQSKLSPQHPNGSIGTLLDKSSCHNQLTGLLNSWAKIQVFRILHNAFGHVGRFDAYHQDQMPRLLGIFESDLDRCPIRTWYNAGEQFDQISPGSLEGLAMYCLLPQTTDHGLFDQFACKATLRRIKGQERLSQLGILCKEHNYTYRLVQIAAKLITKVVANKSIPPPQDPAREAESLAKAIDMKDYDEVLRLLGSAVDN